MGDNQREYFAGAKGDEEIHHFTKPKKETEITRKEAVHFFAEAQSHIVNEKMFKIFLNAITEKIKFGSNDRLTYLQNRIVEACINLSDRDTELIINQFNRSVRDWFQNNFNQRDVDSRVYDSIIRGEYTHGRKNIDPRGIQSVISFLKARTILLDSKPGEEYEHYFSSRLDARFSVDVVERIGNEDNLRVSLIQIKSSVPSGEEIELIHRDHESWVKEEWMSFEEYERSFVEEGTSEETQAFLENKKEMQMALIELLTNPNGFNPDALMGSLHLAHLNNRQRAWILWKYSDLLIEHIEELKKENPEEVTMLNSIFNELVSLKDELTKKAKLPKSQTLVNNVDSLICVGAKEVSRREFEIEGKGKVIDVRS